MKSFKKKEKIHRCIYYFVIISLILAQVGYEFAWNAKKYKLINYIAFSIDAIYLFALIISFFRVHRFMLKFHNQKFSGKLRVALWVYFSFIFLMDLGLILVSIQNNYFTGTALTMYLGNVGFFTYPFLQVIGICIFKSSKDPVSNVSSLGYLKLVSRNQRATSRNYNGFIKDESIEKTEHKTQIMQEFVRNQSPLSSFHSRKSSK